MQLKPVAERTNWPLVAGFMVWLLAMVVMGFSQPAYLALSGIAVGLFFSQVLLNVRIRRADDGS